MKYDSILIATLVLVACEAPERGSRAAPVRAEKQELGKSDRTTWEVTYVPGSGELASAHRRRSGEPDLVVDYVYEGSLIRETVQKRDGKELVRSSFAYDANDDIVAIRTQWEGRPWVESDFTLTDRKLTSARTDIDQGQGMSSSVEDTYRYDDEGQLRSIDSVQKEGKSSVASHVDLVHRDGVLARYDWSAKGEIPLSVELISDDDGKVREINHSDGARLALRYDDEGRVGELERRTESGAVIRWTFEYDDVETVGATFNLPDLVTSEFLDLEGRSVLAHNRLSLGFY